VEKAAAQRVNADLDFLKNRQVQREILRGVSIFRMISFVVKEKDLSAPSGRE